MDYMTEDVYLISGEYYPSRSAWNIDIAYSSGKILASGSEDDGIFYLYDGETKDFFLSVYDGSDEQVYIQYVEAMDSTEWLAEDSNSRQYSFLLKKVPVIEGPHTVRLGDRVTGEIQWEHYFDPDEKPEVTIVSSPSGYVDGLVTIRWEGFDAEGRELTYRLEYSDYEGRPGTWLGSFHVDSTEIELNLGSFRGSRGEGSRFRVIAFNGFNFGIAESDLFAVPFKPARLEVKGDTSPVTMAKGRGFHGTTFWVNLHGPGSSGLTEDDVAWISDIDGFVNRGITLDPRGLSVGTHTISAQVESKAGLVTTETVKTITILDESPQISVRVGDGTGDLNCNEIELDVLVDQVDIEKVSYGFNLARHEAPMRTKDLTTFPVRYQMIDDTSVYVIAVNKLQKSASYREVIEAYDCESLQKTNQQDIGKGS